MQPYCAASGLLRSRPPRLKTWAVARSLYFAAYILAAATRSAYAMNASNGLLLFAYCAQRSYPRMLRFNATFVWLCGRLRYRKHGIGLPDPAPSPNPASCSRFCIRSTGTSSVISLRFPSFPCSLCPGFACLPTLNRCPRYPLRDVCTMRFVQIQRYPGARL